MPHSQPTVSIGMPVYNGEKYIRDALDSLLAQTYTDFELIISDNASTDSTEQICREYATRDARIRYVRQPKNRGAAANFKFVLDEAVGEFFMWAAYDDLWKPSFISNAIIAMNDESIGFAFPSTILKSIRLGIFKRIPRHVFKGFEDADRNRRLLSFANLHQSSHKCNLVYSLFRTDILRNAISVQDISSDSLLSLVLLGATRGVIMDEHDFYKRYPSLWPGFRRKILLKPEKKLMFEKDRDQIIDRAKSIFPEISSTLERIRSQHKPSAYHSGFEIIKNLFK